MEDPPSTDGNQDGNVLGGVQGVVAAAEHAAGEALHHRLSLEMKIAKHSVALPSAEQADGIAVDIRVK